MGDNDNAEIRRLARAVQLLSDIVLLRQQLDNKMKELDDLTAQVAQTDTVIDSAITLINGIADRIAAAGVDPTKLATLTTDLRAKSDSLAAAVQANTPAAPAP